MSDLTKYDVEATAHHIPLQLNNLSEWHLFFYVLNLCFSVSRQTHDLPVPNSWLICFSEFASTVFEPILNLGAIHMFAPWVPTTWSPSYMISRLVQSYSIVSWVFDSGLSVPRHMVNSGISFFAQPHMMHRVHQMITAAAALWFIIRHITALLHSRSTQTTSNKTSSTHELDVDGGDEQRHINQKVREIVANCNAHLLRHFTWGCQLEEGASPEQIRKLDRLLRVELPNDYKTFLQLTNGLKNVLDGGRRLTFLPADCPSFAVKETYQEPCIELRRLHVTWLLESLFGPGTHAELMEQTGFRGVEGERGIRLFKIASRETQMGGVFLVCPKDIQNIVSDWAEVALFDKKRNGSLIGRIYGHGKDYFGNFSSDMEMLLMFWPGWLVLQVDPAGPHYRLYPSFTAFLETLAEITRRPNDDLVQDGLGSHNEGQYADLCRWKWEWEHGYRKVVRQDE
ncbi:hypothetical protein F4801DRAFT_581799 [Xylaria longipes]|nr:hypothetical protein F4801DRAFT_581799 [Xylaria longipes]